MTWTKNDANPDNERRTLLHITSFILPTTYAAIRPISAGQGLPPRGRMEECHLAHIISPIRCDPPFGSVSNPLKLTGAGLDLIRQLYLDEGALCIFDSPSCKFP
jgi:hypothetical protein